MRMHLALVLAVSSMASAQTAKAAVPKPSANEAAAPSDRSAVELPVRRVVLYKNGVGYFEHAGRVRGSQDLSIRFTTAQLNDVLKSLTVVDLAGQVTSVRYNSIAPLSERLSTLRVQLPENATREQFLNAMRGARIEVRSGTAASIGRLLSVDIRTHVDPRTGATSQTSELSVMNDSGDLRTFELTPATSVRFTEPELNREVSRYMQLIATSRAKDVRQMTIGTSGSTDREVGVSYISEVPVWKSTYRVVLPDKLGEKALLQGWAIVDNTVGEDWKDVQLTLVAGAPQSFIQQISQPLYMRRPTVALPTTAQLTPQTHEGTLSRPFDQIEQMSALNAPPPPPPPVGAVGGVQGGQMGGVIGGIIAKRNGGFGGTAFRAGGVPSNMAAINGVLTDPSGAIVANANVNVRNQSNGISRSTRTDSNGRFSFYNLDPSNYSLELSSPGFQHTQMSVYARAGGVTTSNAMLNVASSAETVEVSATPAVDTDSLSLDDDSVAEGSELGDLFQYALKQRVTVLQNQSALVPIVQSKIDAEKVTIWNSNENFPLRALWLKNTSGATLDGGTFNIVEANAFAGEGVLKELKPDERRLISYAADTAVRVKNEAQASDEPYTHIKIVKGIVTLTREQRSSNKYTIHNSDTVEKNVVIEHPARDGWKFLGDTKPEETTADFHRFRVKVAPGATQELKLAEFHPEESVWALTNITGDQYLFFTRGRTVNPKLQEAMQHILDKKSEIDATEVQLNVRRQELGRISMDQQRLRDNMKALKGSAEEKSLTQRYVSQLNQQEDRLAVLNKEIDTLTAQRSRLEQELQTIALSVNLDEAM
jgi:hypothetical protein